MDFCILFRSAFITLLWLAVPFISPAQQSEAFNTTKAISELAHKKDTAKIDLLLLISEELIKSQPYEAFGYAQEALKLSEQIKDTHRTGLSYRAVAQVYRITAVYNKALEYSLQALVQFETEGDSLRAAQCYEDIGIVHMLSGNFEEARISYQKAFKLNRAIHSHKQITSNYMNMGLNYLKVDSVDKGLSYFLVSLMIADSLNMEPEKIMLMKNIGYAYARLGRYEDALGHFYKVLGLIENKQDDLTRSDAQLNIAKGYLQLKNYQAALKYARLGYDLAGSKHFDQIHCESAKVLSEIYAALGNYKEAYAYSKIYQDLSDTIMNAEKANQLSRIQTIYEVNQKEAENSSLRREVLLNNRKSRTRSIIIIIIASLVVVLATVLYLLNKMNDKQIEMNNRLAAQSQELASLNDLKDKFFSFVAHNLKNPFNTIMGFAELMHRAANAKDLKKANEYSGLIHDLSTQVQKVLSNLLEWSRLQRRTFEVKPETVELTGLIKDVVEMNNKEAARKDISLSISHEGNVFVVADRTMITAVLQNLVTNAIHFTPPSGRISIDCRIDDQNTEVSITDTGIGMTPDQLDLLFDFDFSRSRKGTSDHGGAGLGLVICHEMLIKNGGTIQAASEPGKGSTFTFTLPVAIRHDSDGKNEPEHAESTAEDVTDQLLSSETPLNEALIADLKTIVGPKFEEVSRVLSIEDLEQFAKTLIAIGEKYNNLPLTGYGRSLQSLTLGHQVDQIIKILPRFRDYLKKAGIL
jgi:signal transduction histidine kinase